MSFATQIPAAKAGRVHIPRLPRSRRLRDEEFFVASDILDAGNDHRRAEILLRTPDAVLLEKTEALNAACRQAGFKMGLLFISIRIAALSANRLPDGQLPEHHRATLALWTDGFAALAKGGQ
jgi:hypothetical protein